MRHLYPVDPGARDVDGTSAAAADAIRPAAGNLRELACRALQKYGPMTPDEVAARCGMSVLTIRPRITELAQMKRIRQTGEQRRNASGCWARVYEVVP